MRHAFDAFGGRMTHGLRSVTTGLSLALCQQLVELLSGTISASGDWSILRHDRPSTGYHSAIIRR